ncbi:MAG: sensor histidine kinase, partial [Lachnospiraceae bacterium]
MFLQGFRNLVRKIQALKITIYEKELNEKQIELEFAQEQIRPHFFLNCISLIHGIADNKGETDIVTITSILSDYNDSAQKTPAVRKNVRGMNAPITNNATIIPTGFSSGIVGFSWPDVLQNA